MYTSHLGLNMVGGGCCHGNNGGANDLGLAWNVLLQGGNVVTAWLVMIGIKHFPLSFGIPCFDIWY